MEDKKTPQYLYEVASLVRKKTFAVEARFSQEMEDHFLHVHNHFSRFVFTVISDGKAATGNVGLEVLEPLRIKSEELVRLSVQNASKPVSDEKTTPAYTLRFAGGSLKGKTPVEVLLENRAEGEDPYKKGKDVLNGQYKWLKESAEKNSKFAAANKKAMDAILEAAKIPEADLDKMDASETATGRTVSLLDIRTRPLVNRPQVNGKNFVYEVFATYDPSKTYSVNVTVKNYYAPVKKNENGTLNVIASEKESETIGSFDMTLDEWMYVIRNMDSVEKGYYMCHISSAFKMADEADKKRRDAASAKVTKETAPAPEA